MKITQQDKEKFKKDCVRLADAIKEMILDDKAIIGTAIFAGYEARINVLRENAEDNNGKLDIELVAKDGGRPMTLEHFLKKGN